MNNNLFILAIFWGVWIIIPIIFDGFLALIYMIHIITKRAKRIIRPIDPATLPKVSIIIPTYNEEDNINECLNYLKIQTYPQEKMEIIVVDNGSTDQTSEIVKDHMREIWLNKNGHNKLHQAVTFKNLNHHLNGKIKVNGKTYQADGFGGLLRLVVRYEKGKARALNAGIKLSQGGIIINIDCRSFLAPDAIYNMVAKFVENPKYGAATGNIEIDWNLIYRKNAQGQYILDENGHYVSRKLTLKEKVLAKCQFLEYLTSFRLGRQFQDITGSMYTFSGAFSAFRREVLMKTNLYSSRTVSEDTDLTLDLQRQNVRLGFAEEAKAFLKPVISYERFYAQRARWHRGQIEVVGTHLDWYANLTKGFWRNFWLGLQLMIDHTFGFPRIIWMFLLPLFFLFGYSTTLIIKAILLMYIFYIVMDCFNSLYCYVVADSETRKKIKKSYHYNLVMPLFRIITFFFRFAGYLEVLKEPQAWTTPVNPVKSIKDYQGTISTGQQKISALGSNLLQFVTGQKPSSDIVYEEKIPELDSFGAEANFGNPTAQNNNKNNAINFKKEALRLDGINQDYNLKEQK